MKIRRILAVFLALLLTATLPVTALAADWYLEDGDITVSAGANGQTVTQGSKSDTDDAPVITQRDSTTATGSTITVTTTGDAVAEFTLRDVNIEADGDTIDIGNSSAEITLEKGNTLYSESGSAIHVSGGDLTITGSGTLEAEIGGDCDDDDYDNENAKIGSHESEDMSGSIHITGGATVTTKEDEDGYIGDGAAIGSGMYGDMAGDILIDGNAKVTAFSQEDGAAIGSGQEGEMSGSITIGSEAEVIAVNDSDGAAIGSGYRGDLSGSVVITDHARVTAWSESEGAGIGGGDKGDLSGSILIGGHAQVAAGSDLDGAGIGGGDSGDVTETGRIIIRDFAQVTAIGSDEGTGIGAGEGDDMYGRIIIRDNAQVTAIAGDYAAAIGSDDEDDMEGSIIIIGHAIVSTAVADYGWYVPCDEACQDPTSDVYEEHQNGWHYDGEYYKTFSDDDVWFDYDTKEIKYTLNPDAIGYIGDGSESHHDSEYGNYILGSGVTINGIRGSDTERLKEYVNMRLSGMENDGNPENLTILNSVIRNNKITVSTTGNGEILQILYGGEETPPTEPGTYPVTAVMEIDGETMEFELCDLVIPEPEEADDTQDGPLYRVTDRDGRDVSYTAGQKGGVLTITTDRDFAILTGRLSGIRTLKARGVETIVFVTKNATSTLAVDDLLGKGGSSDLYKLTHNGKTVTFTLGA